MSPIRILLGLLCITAAGLLTMTDAKPSNKKTKALKVKKPKVMKMNLRTLTSKLLSLETRMVEMESQMKKIDQVQGVFSDDPPCPVKDSDGFFKSISTGSCYMLVPSDNMMNWTDAQAHCSKVHPKSHLVAIETEEEQAYLKGKWYNECGVSTVGRFWTDGSKLGNDEWYWVTGNNLLQTGYQNWIPGTTHTDERFNCAAVYANEGYAWGDVACWAPHVVTCEIEL